MRPTNRSIPHQLHIMHLDEHPIEWFPYELMEQGGKGAVPAQLPVLRGAVSGLPPHVDALLVVSDLQGTVPSASSTDDQCRQLLGEQLPELLELLIQMEYPIVDCRRVVVVLCGDLYADQVKRGASGDPLPVWRAFAAQFGMVIGVLGNHDLLTTAGEEELAGMAETHCFVAPGVQDVAGIRFAGLGGITGRADRPNRMPEDVYQRTLQQLLRHMPQLLVLHQSPDAPAHGMSGNAMIRSMLEAAEPTVVCCGHIHWKEPLVILENGTQVLNADSRAILLVRNDSGEAGRKLQR